METTAPKQLARFITIARQLARKYRNPDDYISAATFGIIVGLEKASKQGISKEEELTRWIIACMKKCILRMAHLRKESHEVSLDDLKYDLVAPDYNRYNALYEALHEPTVCRDDLDKQIVGMRLEGYVDEEIAIHTQKTQSCIQKRRNGIRKRFAHELKVSELM
jgi:hypothetical protein